ncbi:hypothetical protein CRN67_03000 [Campylobacter blaseri]|uniref:Restriction endonuclease type IV Mrr domain-containing protein n=1 Tax=Campylobacter blaseri TaxID=2042961 RepID=A0A2P8R2R1_9BACT|nr:hypothetical protein CQ405_03000 [Campylobacter blaseri]PSM54435.1 hypothetical protein CRN67_03000 [Campylobacter blaseri]
MNDYLRNKGEVSSRIKPKNKYDWKKAKGNKYEFYIAQFYKNEGYKVYMKGYNEGYQDEGIDLIAYKGKKEMILIQCKNWESGATLSSIKKFVYDCRNYEMKNYKMIRNKQIKKIYCISNEIEIQEINNYIASIKNEIEFLNIPLLK